MNRLWVRLSIILSALMLIFALMPLVSFLIFATTHEPPPAEAQPPAVVTGVTAGITSSLTTTVAAPVTAAPNAAAPQRRDPWSRVPEDLLRAFVFAGLTGVLTGVVASRVLVAPIAQLAQAARRIGSGDLSTRVHIRKHSQEIDELAQSFNKMAADLQHAAEQRNALMADVSHELRTPLTALEGNLRAALDNVYDLDEEQIAILYQQTRHLIRLVNELRELALAEADQLPLYKQPLYLDPLVQETVSIFAPLAEEKGVSLCAELAPGLPPVEADSMRMRQVLHNLLDNALRHTPSGGVIRLSGRREGANKVTLAVQDSGDGMLPEQLAQVFNRFYRTDPARSRDTGGSGLGLAIVKAIVEAHGGEVQATSPGLGQGSTFTMMLPAATAAA